MPDEGPTVRRLDRMVILFRAPKDRAYIYAWILAWVSRSLCERRASPSIIVMHESSLAFFSLPVLDTTHRFTRLCDTSRDISKRKRERERERERHITNIKELLTSTRWYFLLRASQTLFSVRSLLFFQVHIISWSCLKPARKRKIMFFGLIVCK